MRKHFLSPLKLSYGTSVYSANAKSSDLAHIRSASATAFASSISNPCFNGVLNGLLVIPKNPTISHQRRFYYVDSRGFEHFQRKGLGAFHGKDRTRMYAFILITVGSFCTLVYATHQEIVPYTYRKHFVLFSPVFEAKLVESQFDKLKTAWKADILPPMHPQAVRVHKIAKDVIKAVIEGTQSDEEAREGNMKKVVWEIDADAPVLGQWEGHNEVRDYHWADQTRKEGLKKGVKPFVEHLRLAKWEVIVVDKNNANAFCLPGGKIVIFTGFLKQFPGDMEIATVLGHEVAHVVARHCAEKLTHYLFLTLIKLFILAFFYAPDLVRSASTLFLELPFSRRQELEADHIGLLVMAAAGYDPRAAAPLYEKMGESEKSLELLQYVKTHPSGSKRGERLRKTGALMEQAVKIYMEKTTGGRLLT